jgi:hypothetical protein
MLACSRPFIPLQCTLQHRWPRRPHRPALRQATHWESVVRPMPPRAERFCTPPLQKRRAVSQAVCDVERSKTGYATAAVQASRTAMRRLPVFLTARGGGQPPDCALLSFSMLVLTRRGVRCGNELRSAPNKCAVLPNHNTHTYVHGTVHSNAPTEAAVRPDCSPARLQRSPDTRTWSGLTGTPGQLGLQFCQQLFV